MSESESQRDCPRCRELVQRLQQRVTELEARVQKLKELLEQSRRSGKRQAAPFSKGKKGPVGIFLSLLGNWCWLLESPGESVLVHDGEMIEGLLPMVDRLGPFRLGVNS